MDFVENEHLTRQLDIIPIEKLSMPTTIVGAGAVGSWVALSLAKMGFTNITVFDDDQVSIENMNCQFYPYKQIGNNKVDALQRLVAGFANVNINVVNARFEGETRFPGIVISAVDSMEARKTIWEAHKGNSETNYIIDPRMGAETSLLFVMNPNDSKDITSYEKTLYSDDNAVQERCTAKATIYTANLLAGQVCKAVKDIVTENPYTRVSKWDIGKNAAEMYNKKG